MFSQHSSLLSSENEWFGSKARMPTVSDKYITGLIENWLAQKGVTPLDAREDQHDTLLAYSERAASLAARSGDSKLVLCGLLALAPVWHMGDERDAIIILSILYDAAIMNKSDPDQIFREAQRLCFSNRPFRAAIDGFLRRNPVDKTISVMGFVRGSDEDGFRYRRIQYR